MTAYGDVRTDGRSPEAIEHEIARTRERMSVHLDALGHKLSPDHLKHQARQAIVEKVRETGSKALDLVGRHPLPTAAAGLGAAGLVVRRTRGPRAAAVRRSGFGRLLHEHPLAFAVVAAVVGLALGTLVPAAGQPRPRTGGVV
jgi:ElaB/YqjD/DUF883 family membrane-anchored ribosome-binding protein